MDFYITGDCHGDFSRFYKFYQTVRKPVGMICLGDFGINYYLSKRDTRNKKKLLENYPLITFYCVRGNHEARPQDVEGMEQIYDDNVQGTVFYEPEFPNIKYFLDGNCYRFGDRNIFVIGGAYSVDKNYRILNGWQWFENEQLDEKERALITDIIRYNRVSGWEPDLILTHTCPYSLMPTELFLSCVDQNLVDNTMEHWLDRIHDYLPDAYWLFGHFHSDMIMDDKVAMLYRQIISLDTIDDFSKSYVELPEGFTLSKQYCKKLADQ